MPDGPSFAEVFEVQSLGGVALERVELPALILCTGQLVACDATVFDTQLREPFARELPPGRYPVQLVLATMTVGARQKQIPAFARVVFSERPSRRWELATTAGQDVSELQPGHVFGFPIDSGIAAYMDHLAQEVLIDERMAHFDEPADDEDEPPIHRDLMAAMQGDPTCRWGALDVIVEDEPPSNIVAFTSGPGDGVYPCYWGLDDRDQPVELVTDFYVVGH